MNPHDLQNAPVLVVGAGIMGAGIAQLAAQSGHRAMLFDARAGAAEQAIAKLSMTLDALDAHYRAERDRVSGWLRQSAQRAGR